MFEAVLRVALKFFGLRSARERFDDGSELRPNSRESLLYKELDLELEIDLVHDGHSRYTAYVDATKCLKGKVSDAEHVAKIRDKVKAYFAQRAMEGDVM
jgi:hypothetical protein